MSLSYMMSPEKLKLFRLLLAKEGLDGHPGQTDALIPPRDPQSIVPLTPNQYGLWFIEQVESGRANYNIPGAIRLRGPLDVRILERCIADFVNRHEALRTTIQRRADGSPCQTIATSVDVRLEKVAVSADKPEQREAEVQRLANEVAQAGFDLENGPLFRFRVIELDPETHILCANFHHIIADGWSMGIFRDELGSLYRARTVGVKPGLEPLALQFGDYAVWLEKWLESAAAKQHLDFWSKELDGPLPVLELPLDRPRPQKMSFAGEHREIVLGTRLSQAIRTLAAHHGVSNYVFLLAGFSILLYALSNQEEMVVGSTFANRTRPAEERIFGYFANVLPVRVQLTPQMAFRQVLERLHQRVLARTPHQVYPFASLVQDLKPPRLPGRNPFYDVVFDVLTIDRNPGIFGYGLAGMPTEDLTWGKFHATSYPIEYANARFDLAVFLWDQPAGFAGAIEYRKELFGQQTIERWIDSFKAVLGSIVRDPDATVSGILKRAQQATAPAAASPPTRASLHEKLKHSRRKAVVTAEAHGQKKSTG